MDYCLFRDTYITRSSPLESPQNFLLTCRFEANFHFFSVIRYLLGKSNYLWELLQITAWLFYSLGEILKGKNPKFREVEFNISILTNPIQLTWSLDPGSFQKGRNPVWHVHQLIVDTTRFNSGATHKGYTPNSTLPEGMFASPQRIVTGPWKVASKSGSAVIGEEKQVSVIQQLPWFHRSVKSAQVAIQIVNHSSSFPAPGVINVGKLVDVFLRSLENYGNFWKQNCYKIQNGWLFLSNEEETLISGQSIGDYVTT